MTEVQQALGEYVAAAGSCGRFASRCCRGSSAPTRDRQELFREGEITKFVFLDAQRKYNDTVKAYLDSAARHRRSMLDLNTVVGQRIMP